MIFIFRCPENNIFPIFHGPIFHFLVAYVIFHGKCIISIFLFSYSIGLTQMRQDIPLVIDLVHGGFVDPCQQEGQQAAF